MTLEINAHNDFVSFEQVNKTIERASNKKQNPLQWGKGDKAVRAYSKGISISGSFDNSHKKPPFAIFFLTMPFLSNRLPAAMT